MTRPVPAYQQIKQYILQTIHSGRWRTGMAIPTEMRLAEQFSVSRMTVNRALKELSEEKVLERRQGSGTFVAQQQFNHTFVEVRNIADDIRQSGKCYRAEVINQIHVRLSSLPADCQSLFQKAGQLFQLEILHYADNTPIQYEKRWVDSELVPDFDQQDFSQVNTSDYLIRQVALVKGHYVIQAKQTPDQIAAWLKLNSNQPALVLTRYTYSSDDRVVTYVQMWHNGDSFRFSGTL